MERLDRVFATNYAEVGNVRFEAWLPKRESPISAIKPGVYTPVEV